MYIILYILEKDTIKPNVHNPPNVSKHIARQENTEAAQLMNRKGFQRLLIRPHVHEVLKSMRFTLQVSTNCILWCLGETVRLALCVYLALDVWAFPCEEISIHIIPVVNLKGRIITYSTFFISVPMIFFKGNFITFVIRKYFLKADFISYLSLQPSPDPGDYYLTWNGEKRVK